MDWESDMKNFLFALSLLGAILAPTASFAAWGAIACDIYGSGACGASSGWPTQLSAEWRAINACRAGGYDCALHNWEHNMCTYGPNGSRACN
jgi:hypothetical protein